MSERFNALDWISLILVIVGAINWGLVGLFQYNLIAEIFGIGSTVSRVIYALVGVGGLYTLATATKMGSYNRRFYGGPTATATRGTV
ncbi:MAG TPA: DUF378 domain-containing protein [Patescibacteria group bacterium]|nr:DUF378 domain-containing protein [Patescibacteria group bacterium]